MEHVAKNPAVFEIDKLNWINQHYMRQWMRKLFLPQLSRIWLLPAI